jgi:hypothetical protein
MNHQERIELLNALSRAGVQFYKSHDLEIRLGGECQRETHAPVPLSNQTVTPPAPHENDEATEKLKELIGTLKMDDAALVDKIFPAGAGL